ncbi:hypothetical protein EI533_20775 [Pseudomonas donghuensis]|nr:hypothetical protein [Pseudomonas donghuensis]
MDIEFWTKWVTLAGATIAAASGVWSLKLQMQGKRDAYKLGMGTVMPEAIEEEFLNVVSCCDHPIKFADYGFLDHKGKIQSIVMTADVDPHFAHRLIQRGSVKLEKRGDHFEIGYLSRQRIIGCFARTNLELRPRLAFASSTSFLQRTWVWFRIRIKGTRYLA